VVTLVHGTAIVTRASLMGPRSLKFRDEVLLHDRIATGDQSLARILLGGKAVVTVRERSVVTITESPRASSIDLTSGTIALSVAKERMRPGESLEIRTPNAVAGIRGTVVIAEVTRRAADVTTHFTLLTGVIEVLRLDGARHPSGAAAVLHPLQAISVTGALLPVRSITRDDGKAASGEFQLPVKPQAKAGGPDWVARDQVEQAVTIVDTDRGRGFDPRPEKSGKPDKLDKVEKIEKIEKSNRLDRPDRYKPRMPAAPPVPPIVPSTSQQQGGNNNKDRNDRNR
jgi:hypothetical protein